MTTETKVPTAEDVTWDAEALRLDIDTTPHTPEYRAAMRERIARLRDLALLGVQVPGLQKEVDEARAALDDDGAQSQEGATLAHRIAALSEDRKQEKMRAEDAESEVSALQARVAQLTAERDNAIDLLRSARGTLKGLGDSHNISEHAFQELACHLDDEPCGPEGERITTHSERALTETVEELEEVRGLLNDAEEEMVKASSERDALRAQVEDCRTWIRNTATEHGGIGFPCSLMDDEPAALSTPPAETAGTPARARADDWLDSEDPLTPCPNCGEARKEHRDYGTAALCRLR